MSEEEESALHAGSTIIHVGLDGSETESQAGVEGLQEDTNNVSAEEDKEDTEAELVRLTKDWIAPIYSFFNPVPVIGHVNGRRFHTFSCCAKGCNQSICCFLDKADAKSTSNMWKHAKKCWGRETVEIVDKAKNATVA
ncbi:hypothetical protein BDR06DRAFT_1004828 [Suillus hirtellus]|nr:hypothetical protein BDR06DRAFT_1004828 [Suillus hirtellus]